jgi:hypothetical protein
MDKLVILSIVWWFLPEAEVSISSAGGTRAVLIRLYMGILKQSVGIAPLILGCRKLGWGKELSGEVKRWRYIHKTVLMRWMDWTKSEGVAMMRLKGWCVWLNLAGIYCSLLRVQGGWTLRILWGRIGGCFYRPSWWHGHFGWTSDPTRRLADWTCLSTGLVNRINPG